MRVVAFSSEDVAGSNIARILEEDFNLDDNLLIESSESIVNVEYLTDLKPEVCFVASRHRSESKQPTLTAHVTGNFGKAGLGGNDGELALAPALYLREAMNGLFKYGGDSGYAVSLEVTHHGPTSLQFPLVFVEVGSTLEQWNDLDACGIVANVLNDLLLNEPENVPVALGFGGPHYAPNFTPILGKVALGHILPKYASEFLSRELVEQMVEKTVPRPELAVLDWKGLRGVVRKELVGILDEVGLPWRRSGELK